jgi:hypothetical protein
MNTLSAQTTTGHRHVSPIAWTDQHQWATTIAAIAIAVLAGVLLGILFSMASSGPGSATLHRAGGHALATVAQAQHAAAAAVTAVTTATSGDTATVQGSRTRSPARGGFAVGRTAGAGSGFIVIRAGTRAPVRGGFAGRSLGAGHAPAVSVTRSTVAGG